MVLVVVVAFPCVGQVALKLPKSASTVHRASIESSNLFFVVVSSLPRVLKSSGLLSNAFVDAVDSFATRHNVGSCSLLRVLFVSPTTIFCEIGVPFYLICIGEKTEAGISNPDTDQVSMRPTSTSNQ